MPTQENSSTPAATDTTSTTPAVESQETTTTPAEFNADNYKDNEAFNNYIQDRLNEKLNEKNTELETLKQVTSAKDKKINELFDELKPLTRKFKDKETLELFKGGKIEEYNKKIEENAITPFKEIVKQQQTKFEKREAELLSQLDALTKENQSFKGSIKNSKLKEYFKDKGIKDEALEDAIRFAGDDFDITEDMEFKNKQTEDYKIENWLESQREKRSYLFKEFEGTGITGKNRISGKNSNVDLGKASMEEYRKERLKRDGKI